ncbi:MAG: putative organic radical activating enzyme [Bacteroidota bacterium]|jgi:organic radical activating enzyme
MESLPVMEQFYTLQGEGVYSGCPAYFIRLAGCDVGCVWCDVKESWNASDHPKKEISVLVDEVMESGANRVIITGGEPLMHNLDTLTRLLRDKGIKTHIETSGTHPLSGEWDWITFSPKKFKKPTEEIFQVANELKVIVFHPSDIQWAVELSARVAEGCQNLLQPEWERQDDVLPIIMAHLTQNPTWRLSLQTHKFIGVR